MASISGYSWAIIAAIISCSLGDSKTWIQNNEWGSKSNWNLQRLPCSNDIVNIEEDDASVFVRGNLTMKELILPRSGSLILVNGVELAFPDGSSLETCQANTSLTWVNYLGSSPTYTNKLCDWLIQTMKDNETIEINFQKNESKTIITFVLTSQSQNPFVLGAEIKFTGSASNNWFDVRNWQTSTKTYYPWQVPCQHDVVRFPRDSSFNVKINKNVIVSQLFIGDQELDEAGLTRYTTANNELQQISLAESVSLRITGKKCTDKTGCVCGNDKQKDHICEILGKCPDLQCKQTVKPSGACCTICGTVMLLHISNKFNKVSIDQKIKILLNEYTGVNFTSIKIEERLVQIVLEDSLGEKSKDAAYLIQKTLSSDESSNVLRIEIVGEKSSPLASKRSADLKTGLYIAIPVFVLVVGITVIAIYFVKRNGQRGRQEPVYENSGVEIDETQGARINPMYESTIEMGTVGQHKNALDPSLTNGQCMMNQADNPLYEISLSSKGE